jgi:hypothetical protein
MSPIVLSRLRFLVVFFAGVVAAQIATSTVVLSAFAFDFAPKEISLVTFLLCFALGVPSIIAGTSWLLLPKIDLAKNPMTDRTAFFLGGVVGPFVAILVGMSTMGTGRNYEIRKALDEAHQRALDEFNDRANAELGEATIKK